jgi:hypothetical protein
MRFEKADFLCFQNQIAIFKNTIPKRFMLWDLV